jgi:cellulose synthase/poly-beta-1,6-N-acetylglucosamine synthase-like glycosyltransferase
MAILPSLILYALVFLAMYVQVFFLVTLFENRKKIVIREGEIKLSSYPAVTIIVPSYNEEKTIYKTVRSVLNLNYPKDKLKVFLIDDGSTDGTWNVISKFAKIPNVKVFQKENGGKYTALNLGLQNLETNFVGCLDADSIVDREALVRIMSYFERDMEAMAVVPSVTVNNPKTFIQIAQKAEYNMGIYSKKMLGFLGAINVTPGPFTIFRKKVFDDLGPYKHAHNTEDMEIAYRMQKYLYKIDHCNDAFVYTNAPATVKKLYKQRLRWIYGFLNNTIDYRDLVFKRKYGNFAFFTLPTGLVSILTVCYLFSRIFYNIGHFIYSKFLVYQTVGFQSPLHAFNFDLFFLNTQSYLFINVLIYSCVVFAIIFGRRMVENKWTISFEMLYFLPVFSVIAPFWFMRAILNTILNKTPNWK